MHSKHPKDRAARRRSAEAKALEKLRPHKIDGKKRKIITDLKQKEADDELHDFEIELGNLSDRELVDESDPNPSGNGDRRSKSGHSVGTSQSRS